MSTSEDDDKAHRHRGPYRVGDVSTGDRTTDLLRDPQVGAFFAALMRIRDPEKRALIEALVREFAHQKKMSGG